MTTIAIPDLSKTELIRLIVGRHGRLPGGGEQLPDDGDLYAAGLTSLGTVGVMLAIEEQFDIEFPESRLNRATFRSVAAITAVVTELTVANQLSER